MHPRLRSSTFTPNGVLEGKEEQLITIALGEKDKMTSVERSVEEMTQDMEKRGIAPTVLVEGAEVPLSCVVTMAQHHLEMDTVQKRSKKGELEIRQCSAPFGDRSLLPSTANMPIEEKISTNTRNDLE